MMQMCILATRNQHEARIVKNLHYRVSYLDFGTQKMEIKSATLMYQWVADIFFAHGKQIIVV
jgi:hypothetical protein